jgi:PAS domain S-box-containing protein
MPRGKNVMREGKGPHKRGILSALMLIIAAVVLTTCALFTALLIEYRAQDILTLVDARLLTAVEMTREMLGTDYHDRIVHGTSVSNDEFNRIVRRNDELCSRLDLQYLWSVLQVDGRLVFTSATHSDWKDPKSSCAAFFETHSDPKSFAPALKSELTPVCSSFRNNWGAGRMILFPRKDANGRTYIFGASVQLTELNAMVRRTMLTSCGIGLAVMAAAFMLALLLARRFSAPIARLTKAAEQMATGDFEVLLEPSGTRELQSLSSALDQMRNWLKMHLAELRKSEERHRTILQAAQDGFVLTDLEGRLLEVNEAYCRMSGYSARELLTMRVQDLDTAETAGELAGHLRAVPAKGQDCFEARHRRKDENVLDLEVSVQYRPADGGQFVTFLHDISERKRAERRLAESNQLLAGVLEHTHMLAVYLDAQFNFIWVNRAYALSCKHEPSFFPGKNHFDLYPHDENQAIFQRVVDTGLPFFVQAKPFEYPDQPGRGVTYWDWSLTPVKDAGGCVTGLVFTLAEVTDRIRTERILRDTTERLDMAQRAARVGMWDWNVVGGSIEWSPLMFDIFGLDRLKCPPGFDSWRSAVHPEDRDTAAKRIEQALAQRALLDSDYRIVLPNGEIRWINASGEGRYDGNGQPLRMLGICRDITERKRAEEALRESEGRVRAKLDAILLPEGDIGALELGDLFDVPAFHLIMEDFFRLTGVAVAFVDIRGKVLVSAGWQDICTKFHRVHPESARQCLESDTELSQGVEPGTTKMYKCKNNLRDVVTPLTVGGRHIGNLFLGQFLFDDEPLDRELFVNQARRFGFDETEYLAAYERLPRVSREGIRTALNLYAQFAQMVVRLSHGNIRLAQILAERERLTHSLRDSQAMLQYVLDNVPQSIFWKDLNCVYLGCNQVFAEAMGLQSPASIVGKTDYDLPWPREQVEAHRADDQRVISLNAPQLHFVERGLKADGTAIWADTSRVPLVDGRGAVYGVLGVYDDVTERKLAEEEREKLQEQLVQAQKMESVGHLAGGIAHDFNNMLAVILGHAEVALGRTDKTQSIHEDLEEIRMAAERSANLTRQLLTFARRQTVAPKVIDLNQAIEGTLKMLQRTMGENINIALKLESGLWKVRVDPSQIDQILANLCINARDAIAGVGNVIIETGNRKFTREYCAAHPDCMPGDYVQLAVGDDGCGMNKEILSRMFEPFFTTKGLGRGTGLGLASVYGAVKQNRGAIEVSSEPGKGTTIEVFLPRHMDDADDVSGKCAPEPAKRGHETILLVEDDEALLKLTAKLLTTLGYTVLSTGCTEKALDLANAHGQAIQLLLSDVVMPRMNGRDLADAVRPVCLHGKVLFMSGYPADVIAPYGILDEGVHLIHKPFTIDALAAKVREVLDN